MVSGSWQQTYLYGIYSSVRMPLEQYEPLNMSVSNFIGSQVSDGSKPADDQVDKIIRSWPESAKKQAWLATLSCIVGIILIIGYSTTSGSTKQDMLICSYAFFGFGGVFACIVGVRIYCLQ